MKVTLTDHTTNPEFKIAQCAAICYDADTSDDACKRRMEKLMNVKHLATLRFAYATFHVSGISRACSHQLVRHPHLSYLQRSQRYCNDTEQEWVAPDSINDDILNGEWDNARTACQIAYDTAIAAGVPKGDARYILPQAVTTELYISGNFQAWYDFLINRLDKSAQWEIRQVAERIRDELVGIAPNVFKEFTK